MSSSRRLGPAGPTVDHDHSGPGEGGSDIDVGTITVDDINIDDDDSLDFGTDDDFSMEYQSANDRLRLFNGNGDILRVPATGVDAQFMGGVALDGRSPPTSGLAIGAGSVVTYPADSGVQTLVNMPVSGTPAAGTQESYAFHVNDETILTVFTEADGTGGIQNARVDIPVDLTVDGQTTQVDDIVTTDVFVEDSGATDQIHLSGDTATVFAQFLTGGEIRTGGGGAEGITVSDEANDRSMLDFNEGSGIVVNEPGAAVDLRVESVDSPNMLTVHGQSSPSGSQVSFGTGVNNDWGTIFVSNRDASGAAEIDLVATLGETGGAASATIQGNNSEVWATSLRPPTITAGNATTVTDAAPLFIDGPISAGNNVTITNNYLALMRDSGGMDVWYAQEDGTVEVSQGPFELPDGMAASPSATFFNDTDLGLFRQGADSLGIAANGAEQVRVGTTELQARGIISSFRRAEPGSGSVIVSRDVDTTSGDELRMTLTTSGLFRYVAHDSSAATQRNLWEVNPDSQQFDMLATLNFPNITGTPTMASHDHSEGGMATIPAAGLATPFTDLQSVFGSPVTAGANIGMGSNAINGDDGFEIIFGTGDDMDVTYVSGNDALEWSDRGTSTRMQLDRTTGNLNIEGSLTEGAAL